MRIDLHRAKLTAILFLLAVGVNYVWELAQRPFYAGGDDFRAALWHCFVAALGDGLLVILIFASAAVAQGSFTWFIKPVARGYAAMVGAAVVIGFAVEWWGLRIVERWKYSERMPLIPLIDIGIVPLLQMILLPPLIFWIMRRSMSTSSPSLDAAKK